METIKLHHNTIETLVELDLWDSRLMNCALLGSNQSILFNKKKHFPVDIDKYAELSNLGHRKGEAYAKALESVRKLQETPISIELPSGTVLVTSIIYEFKHFDSLQTLSICWNEDFRRLISGNMDKGTFMFPVVSMVSIGSSHRYLLYLLLEKHLWKLGSDKENRQVVLSKEEIRSTLGLGEDTYTEWKDVSKRIVKPTLDSIYNTMGIRLVSKVKGDTVVFKLAGEAL